MPPYTKKASTSPAWSVYDGNVEIVGRIPTEYQADATIRKLNEAYAKGLKEGGVIAPPVDPVEPDPIDEEPVDPPPVEPPPSGETVQANPSNFSTVSASASGKTVVLADGNYGTLTLSGRAYAQMVRFKAANRYKAVFSKVLLTKSCANMDFDGIEVTSDTFRVDYSSRNITLRNSRLKRGYYAAWGVTNVAVLYNDITSTANAVIFNAVQHFTFEGNIVHDVGQDLLRVTDDSAFGKILNNTFRDGIATAGVHPDCIQFIGANGATPHDILIRGNHLYDNPDTGVVFAQGIWLNNPASGVGYKNITVEQNLVAIGSPQSIVINNGTSGNAIRNNSVKSWTVGGGGGRIRFLGSDCSGTTVEGNIAKGYDFGEILEKKPVMRTNYTYTDPEPYQGDGRTWQGFLPKPGSPIDFGSPYGAQVRLKELQAA
jgi:hypothetical protein